MSVPMLLAAVPFALLALAGGLRLRSAEARRLARRARALGRRRRGTGAVAAEPQLVRARSSRLDRLAQRYLPRPAVLSERLRATGLPVGLGAYAAGSAALTVAIALGLVSARLPLLVAGFAAVPAGLLLPHHAVGYLIRLRRRRFLRLFPEAIGLMVRGLRSGVPVMETVDVVSREIQDPVGEEFRRVRDQVALGLSPEEALSQAARRVGASEFNFLVISMAVQRETGGNLAETLENLEQILRKREQMRLKVKAMASEASASALIIGSLPFLMSGLMSFASPGYIAPLFSDPLGHVLLAVGAGSLIVGALVMRQMVRFEI